MFSLIKNLILTDTGKDAVIVSIGTFINIVAGGLFFILTPRILGPEDYGLFSTVIATGLMAASIANFGIDTGILKFAKLGSSDFNKILSLAFKSYIFLGFLVTLIGIIFAHFLASFLDQPQITALLRIAFFGNMFILLTNFYVASLQARHQFAKASIVNIVSNVSRLTVLALSAYFFTVGLYFLTIIFFSATLVSAIAGKFLMPFKYEKNNKADLLNFHKFNVWIALSLIISTVPYENYLLLIIAAPIIQIIFGANFEDSVIVFRILAAGFIFFIASTIPSSIILYHLGKSKISFLITVIRYLTFVVLLLLLVPSIQATGAAIAFSSSEFLSFILMTAYLIYQIKSSRTSKDL